MKVKGHTITDALLEQIISRMMSGIFASMEIEGIAERSGIPRGNGDAMRVADRVIQRERQAGNIAIAKRGTWVWVKKTEA